MPAYPRFPVHRTSTIVEGDGDPMSEFQAKPLALVAFANVSGEFVDAPGDLAFWRKGLAELPGRHEQLRVSVLEPPHRILDLRHCCVVLRVKSRQQVVSVGDPGRAEFLPRISQGESSGSVLLLQFRAEDVPFDRIERCFFAVLCK